MRRIKKTAKDALECFAKYPVNDDSLEKCLSRNQRRISIIIWIQVATCIVDSCRLTNGGEKAIKILVNEGRGF